SHLLHPLAWLGARQWGSAGTLFGGFGFVVPGLAAAGVALGLRADLPRAAGRPARIGAQLALLAALAFAAQGLLPLDLEGEEGGASRWHALAWLSWALAFPLGGLGLALGLCREAGARALAWVGGMAAVVGLAGAFLAGGWVGPARSQRLASAAWLAGCCYAAVACRRGCSGCRASAVPDIKRQDQRRQHQGDDVGQDHRPRSQHDPVGQPEA